MIVTVLLLVVLPLWAFLVGPSSPRLSATVGLIGAALLPFTTPATIGPWQMAVAAGAVIYAAKSWERAFGNERDPRMLCRFSRFLVWWFVPLDSRVVVPAKIRETRRTGLRRGARGVLKLGVAGLLVAAGQEANLGWTTPWITSAWSMALLYTFISGVADVVTAIAMLLGFDVSEPFLAPYLARSPRDFWSKRWNRYVSEFARRNLYWSWHGRRYPMLAAGGVFLVSGLMHEYLIVALLRGLGSHTGWNLGFFLIHYLAMVLDSRLALFARITRGAAAPVHIGFLWLTAPLFFIPLDEAAGFTTWSWTPLFTAFRLWLEVVPSP